MGKFDLKPITNTTPHNHLHGTSCGPSCKHGVNNLPGNQNESGLVLLAINEPVLTQPKHHDHHEGCGCPSHKEAKPTKKQISFTPLMGRIIKSNLSPNQKEILITGSFLTSALPVTKITGLITKALGLDSFTSSLITAPLAISSMHFANRGKENLPKLGLILATSLSGLGLQKVFSLPKSVLRTFLTTVVFFVEKFRPDKITQDEKNSKEVKLEKDDFLKLGKTLAAILSVPALLNTPIHAATEAIDNGSSTLNKFLGHVGLTAAQILGLTFGFFGFGKAFNYGVKKLGLNENSKTTSLAHNHPHNHNHKTSAQTEGTIEVCGCCSQPVCVETVAEGVTESVESSLLYSLFS